ncbi:hypothetical protein DFP72DRAFT_188944 [Ephemerocybe angulata]|uniref:Fungal-type protein kinase domain-containing protein n=1 Tax=Ephemerocybe angulata TaxID=980116 RepID=A0A8H6I5D5_9AGAR|nr:hypothetical protein DFP72DRAFT_188944 [Tulosesus angulatus]
MEEVGLQVNGLRLSLVPDVGSDGEDSDDIDDNASDDSVEGGQRTGEGSNLISPFGLTVPVAFRLNEEDVAQNQRQLVQAMGESMDDDMSRNFIYGISIEGDRVSLWYSTRHTTVKATSFSYVKRPDLLIRVLVSLFSADRDALGHESHITRLADGSYLYELDRIAAKASNLKSIQRLRSKAGPKQDHSFFFKTTNLVSAGNSRIWKAVEVMSKSNPKAKPKCREIILKDTWVDADTVTEFDLQAQLFHDIDVLKQSDWESLPILSCIPRDRPEFARLRDYLQGDTYKSLFLRHDGRMRYTSPSEKSFPSEKIWKASNTHPPTGNPEPRKGTTRPDPLDSKPPSVSPKKRCFFVFPDTCKRVSDLPSLGDAMSVLNQACFALLIMFCAGWVHRDISDGNILAIEVDGKWEVKLADLEYAKKVSPKKPGSPDPKTGTPYFMAHEIRTSVPLCFTGQETFDFKVLTLPTWDEEEDDSEPAGPDRDGEANPAGSQGVVHTFFHDLESLWWLILWLITSRIGCDASKIAAQDIFRVSSFSEAAANVARGQVFTQGLESILPSLHNGVKIIAKKLDPFRVWLHGSCIRNTAQMRLVLENYAPACVAPMVFFKSIENFRDEWAFLPLQRPTTTMEVPRIAPHLGPLAVPPPSEKPSNGSRQKSKRKSLHPDNGIPGSSMERAIDEDEDRPGPSKKKRTLPVRVKRLARGGA